MNISLDSACCDYERNMYINWTRVTYVEANSDVVEGSVVPMLNAQSHKLFYT